jgi:hypothetical protein
VALKGLTDDAGDQEIEKQRMRRLRNIVAGAIVAIDVTLIALGLWRHGVWIKGESSVVELFTLFFLSVTVLSAAAWTVSTGRSLAALFPWRSPGSRLRAGRGGARERQAGGLTPRDATAPSAGRQADPTIRPR